VPPVGPTFALASPALAGCHAALLPRTPSARPAAPGLDPELLWFLQVARTTTVQHLSARVSERSCFHIAFAQSFRLPRLAISGGERRGASHWLCFCRKQMDPSKRGIVSTCLAPTEPINFISRDIARCLAAGSGIKRGPPVIS
jgi:hypothetical protein